MSTAPRLLSRFRLSWRRPITAALLGLQVLIAVSSVVELRQPDRPVAHVHDHETRHLFVHDESNCGLCAARTQVVDVPEVAVVITTYLATTRATFVDRDATPARVFRAAHPTRAPPQLT